MIDLPDFEKAFAYENDFYLTCQPSRIAKAIAHYEAFKMIRDVPGVILECGVFKGASFVRFAAFREMFGGAESRRMIAFDTFAEFPKTGYADDQMLRTGFIAAAGASSISDRQLMDVLQRKGCARNVELIAGDILETVPAFVERNPGLKIALLNLDTDVLEPARIVLEHLYPRMSRNGVVLLDNYGVFPGETAAIDACFAGMWADGGGVRRFPFAATPSYMVVG
ncbi:TylF/MycF/NovP-related O-methyltransferase [Azospirillum tabaci]|uniref:TylF/MycF/NovP-related O-methyltransferase n=1 Tax=Azospirillum tabaci TaxID=2752310 RepID=UPI0016610228|nr:TylF/MycF/NovP-related O-methyltransferase [Azospirillum tabaci]